MRLNETIPIADNLIQEYLKNSSQGIFEVVFKYYYSGLVVYADQIIHDTRAAEDIVQIVFMKLWETRHSLEIKSFRSYLIQCVKNRCIDHLRKQLVRNKFAKISNEFNLDETEDDFWTKSELEELLQKSMDKLPPRCREIFIMSRMENLKIAEIAEKLKLSGRTIETQISKALKFLRIELAEYLTIIFLFLK